MGVSGRRIVQCSHFTKNGLKEGGTMYFEQFYEGQAFVSDKHTVTMDEMLDFAGKYDPQRIHTDPDFARQGMYGDLIGSGLMTLSLGWGLFVRMNVLGEESGGGIAMNDIRFLAPVFPGDTLCTEATMVETRPSGSRPQLGLITFTLTVKNQEERPVLTCKITGYVQRRDAEGAERGA
jgi:acyl dehydratase